MFDSFFLHYLCAFFPKNICLKHESDPYKCRESVLITINVNVVGNWCLVGILFTGAMQQINWCFFGIYFITYTLYAVFMWSICL